jgi:hypothetical protein
MLRFYNDNPASDVLHTLQKLSRKFVSCKYTLSNASKLKFKFSLLVQDVDVNACKTAI